MKEAIETRELFILGGGDCIVRGTHHKASNDCYYTRSTPANRDRIGIVFLNSLSPTRAWKGDASVYWADSFAACGYSSFRLDLPGFGDSQEDPPADLLRFIDQGGYASMAADKIKELVTRFNLSRVVIAGHCAGAITAIYTASTSRECGGLILLDPYLHVPLAPRSRLWGTLTGLIPLSALDRLMASIFDRVLRLANQPPRNSNSALLSRWKELVSGGLPILIFNTPTNTQRGGEFDYVSYILERAGSNSQVAVKVIQGAYHSFANLTGRAAVRQHAERWLKDYFPLMKDEEDSVASLCSKRSDDESQKKTYQNCVHGLPLA